MFFRVFSWLLPIVFYVSLADAVEIKLYGSTTVAANLFVPHKKEIESKSGQVLKVTPSGSLQGVRDLISGEADIAMISAPLERLFEKIESEEREEFIKANLKSYQVGQMHVSFTVHKMNPVKALTFAQITDILEGRFKNWKDFGGKDEVITVVLENLGGGIRTIVQEKLLSNGKILAFKHEAKDGAEIPKIVSIASNALGVMSGGLANGSFDDLKTDGMIEQPLILVTKGEPSKEMMSVIESAKSFS